MSTPEDKKHNEVLRRMLKTPPKPNNGNKAVLQSAIVYAPYTAYLPGTHCLAFTPHPPLRGTFSPLERGEESK
jgi:hypothetical protein